MHVRYATSNSLQLAFDSEPWAPTLPDDFVVVPNEIRQVAQNCWSGADQANKKQPRRAGMIVPKFGKNSRPTASQTIVPTKSPSGGVTSRTGKIYVVGSTAPPMEMYHRARGWKNCAIWAGTFPGRHAAEVASWPWEHAIDRFVAERPRDAAARIDGVRRNQQRWAWHCCRRSFRCESMNSTTISQK
jgi:hypothetical protein